MVQRHVFGSFPNAPSGLIRFPTEIGFFIADEIGHMCGIMAKTVAIGIIHSLEQWVPTRLCKPLPPSCLFRRVSLRLRLLAFDVTSEPKLDGKL